MHKHMPFAVALLTAPAMLTAAACATDPALDAGSVDALPRFALEEELRIGSVDDPDLGFSSINGVDVDRDGNLYVLDLRDRYVRVFDPAGQPIGTIGRRGEGPGEFSFPMRLGVVGDTVWVDDSRLNRITLFARDGTVLATVPTSGVTLTDPDPAMSIRVQPSAFRADGLLVGTPSFRSPVPPPGATSVSLPQLLFDQTGAVVDTAGWLDVPHPDVRKSYVDRIEVDGRAIPMPRPGTWMVSEAPMRLTHDEGVVLIKRPVATGAEGGVFTVTNVGLDGDTTFHREYRYTPREYDDVVMDTIVAATAQMLNGFTPREQDGGYVAVYVPNSLRRDLEAVKSAMREAMEFPPFQPPIQSARLGNDGAIWLLREEDGGASLHWTILEPEGEPRGQLDAPRDLDIAWSGGDTVWCIDRDGFDVPWLVKYRIVPPGEG